MSSSQRSQQELIDLEIGRPWYVRSGAVVTRHRRIWGLTAVFTFVLGNHFYGDIMDMLRQKRIVRHEQHNNCLSCALVVLAVLLSLTSYIFSFIIVYSARLPGPYRLRRSEKISFDCAFVVVCSCWTLHMRDPSYRNTAILGLIYCFHLIPMLNLWWDFQNFAFWDCLLTVLIEAALFYSRDQVVLLMAVGVVGVAIQLKKNVYQEQSIKSSVEK